MVVLYKSSIQRFLQRYGETVEINITKTSTTNEFDQDYTGTTQSKTIKIITMSDEEELSHGDLGIAKNHDLTFGTNTELNPGDRIDRDMDGEIEYVVERVKPINYRETKIYFIIGCKEA